MGGQKNAVQKNAHETTFVHRRALAIHRTLHASCTLAMAVFCVCRIDEHIFSHPTMASGG